MTVNKTEFPLWRTPVVIIVLAVLLGIVAGTFVVYLNNPVYIFVGLAGLIAF